MGPDCQTSHKAQRGQSLRLGRIGRKSALMGSWAILEHVSTRGRKSLSLGEVRVFLFNQPGGLMYPSTRTLFPPLQPFNEGFILGSKNKTNNAGFCETKTWACETKLWLFSLVCRANPMQAPCFCLIKILRPSKQVPARAGTQKRMSWNDPYKPSNGRFPRASPSPNPLLIPSLLKNSFPLIGGLWPGGLVVFRRDFPCTCFN